MTYPLDRVIHLLNNWAQALVQKVDSVVSRKCCQSFLSNSTVYNKAIKVLKILVGLNLNYDVWETFLSHEVEILYFHYK